MCRLMPMIPKDRVLDEGDTFIFNGWMAGKRHQESIHCVAKKQRVGPSKDRTTKDRKNDGETIRLLEP